MYLKMYEEGKLENFPIGKLFSQNIDTFMTPFEDTEISSNFTYYCIEIYYNHESKEYEYVEWGFKWKYFYTKKINQFIKTLW